MGTPACRPLFPDNEGITLAMWRIRWSSSAICWPLARIHLLDPCTVVGQGRARIAFPELIDADYRVRREAGRAFLSSGEEVTMDKRQIGITLWLSSLVLIVAWLTEAILRDRSFVAMYLAPVAVLGNILAVYVIKETEPAQHRN